MGTAVRAAQILGLNKDPFQLRPMSPIAAEVRRRVWWQLFHIDVLVSVSSGLPPIIGEGTWKVDSVSELREDLIGTTRGMEYDQEVRMGRRLGDDARNGEKSMTSTPGMFVSAKLHETGSDLSSSATCADLNTDRCCKEVSKQAIRPITAEPNRYTRS